MHANNTNTIYIFKKIFFKYISIKNCFDNFTLFFTYLRNFGSLGKILAEYSKPHRRTTNSFPIHMGHLQLVVKV